MSDPISRRQFLAAALIAPGAAAVLDLARPDTLHALALDTRAAGTRIKPSLNAYSFIEQLEANAKDPSKGIDLFGVCDFCAKVGFDGVDLTGYFFPGYPNAPDDAYIYTLKRHAFDLGLGISGTGVRNDFTAADRAIRAEGIARVKTWIEVASELGAPVVRAFAESQRPFRNWHEASGNASRDTVEGWAADALRECADHGGKHGVIVAVQNHADFITTGPEHLHLLERVNHPWCKAVVDTGSYLTDDPYADIALLAPHAANWQLKEMARPTLPSPRVDIKRVVGIVHRSGYHGYLPVETLRMGRADYDSFTAVPKILAELRQALDEVPGA